MGVMMQYFEWYYPADGSLWKKAACEANYLKSVGITALWLPPAYKGQAGNQDVGYGVYDLYDLGEFNQKGSIGTKYGTKAEYLAAIKALHKAGIQVYGDIVLNHKMGADEMEEVPAREMDPNNRFSQVGDNTIIEAWTKFTFPGRGGKYSDFVWNHTHFDGVDYDQRNKKTAIYNFLGSNWDDQVDGERGNYDYLMGADISFQNPEVVEELKKWGIWYVETTGVDGLRLDAVKHIKASFFSQWLGFLRENFQKELFAVGEYWNANLSELQSYMEETGGCMSLFDVPLHFHFFLACNSNGNYDMRNLLEGTLVKNAPEKAVTFVENHDTQEGQALQSVVTPWFLPIAYGVILLRPQGYPCIFFGDYYGIASRNVPGIKEVIDKMLTLRNTHMTGEQHDYFDHPDIVGWTFSGEGMAVLITDGPGGQKRMYIGEAFKGMGFYDYLGFCKNIVTIENDGCGTFEVSGGSISVWIRVK